LDAIAQLVTARRNSFEIADDTFEIAAKTDSLTPAVAFRRSLAPYVEDQPSASRPRLLSWLKEISTLARL